MKRAVSMIAAGAVCIGSVLPASAEERFSRFEQIQSYSFLLAMVALAGTTCDGVTIDFGLMMSIRARMGLTEADAGMVEEETARHLREFKEGLKNVGRTSWCAGAWTLLGDDGVAVKGLLIDKTRAGEH